jgi:hypothetical protein
MVLGLTLQFDGTDGEEVDGGTFLTTPLSFAVIPPSLLLPAQEGGT